MPNGSGATKLIDRCLTLDPDDRRVWRIGITASGRTLGTQIAAIDQDLRTELRLGISRGERQALTATLTRLQRNLHQARATDASNASPTQPS